MRRAFLFLLLGCLLALSWWRSPLPLRQSDDPSVRFVKLDVAGFAPLPDGLTLEAAWQLIGRNDHFGGYSALVPLGSAGFLAGSDRGRFLRFSDPTDGQPATSMGWLAPGQHTNKGAVDIESLTRDPESGRIWIGYEGHNAIERRSPDLSKAQRVKPPAMRGWPSNGGPEAMVRLRNGRFLVLAETKSGWLDRMGPALLFPRDPVTGSKPVKFQFRAPPGYLPTDVAQLPDGRVLILVRSLKLGLPPHFSNKLILADPATIRPGKVWSGREIALLDRSVPMDNYEGIAITALPEGAVAIWLVSDDNVSAFQRSLLLKLHWVPPPVEKPAGEDRARKKARRDAGAP